jgi:NAD dependent epimerase/dehydratase family enzyme
LPLIVGKNPPGNLGKMIEAIKNNRYMSIDSGKAKKSGVLASDVAELIANSFTIEGVYNLTDRYHPSFREYEKLISEQLGKSLPKNLPLVLAKIIGLIGDVIPVSPVNSDTVKKMTQGFIISDDKAVRELNWAPNRIIDHFKIK